MAIQKPYEISIKDNVIDGQEEYQIRWKVSGDTSTSFSINIYNNSDGILTYSLPRTYSLGLSFIIPPGSIVNGFDYKINITVWNSNEQSATSDFVVFTASSKPTVVISPIGTIGNHSNVFSAIYTQAENNPIRSYVANLYNSDQKLIKTSGELTDGLVEYRFDLMKNGQSYYVEFVVTSKLGLSKSTGLVSFNVVYTNPDMYFTLDAESLNDKASVRLHWKVIQAIGKTSVEPIYINNEELDVRDGKVFFDEGFNIGSNFTLKIWFRDITQGIDLVHLKGSNGIIRVQYNNDSRFHMYKEIGGFISHYATSQVDGNEIFLCIQQINGNMNLYAEIIS